MVSEKGEERLCKGYGFVNFSLEQDAEKALAHFHGRKFMGNKLRVDFAKPRERGERPGARSAAEDEAPPAAPAPKPAAPAPKPAQPRPAAVSEELRKRKREAFKQKEKKKEPGSKMKSWRLIIRNLAFKVSAFFPLLYVRSRSSSSFLSRGCSPPADSCLVR